MKYSKYPSYRDSEIEWLDEIPKNWDVMTLKRITSRIIVGLAEAATHAYTDEGIVILRATNIRKGEIVGSLLYLTKDFANSSERNSKKIKENDLITVRTGNAGVTAIATSMFDGAHCFTMLVTTLMNNQSSKFYEYYIGASIAQSYFALEGWGTAQINISVPILQNLPIIVPPLSEQRLIVDYLNDKTGRIDTLIAKQIKLMELLKEKRQATVDSIIHQKSTVDMRLGRVINRMTRPVNRKANEEYTALGLYNRGRGLFHKSPKEEVELGDSDFYWVQEDDLIISGQFAWEGSVALASEKENGCIVSHRYPVIRGKSGILDTEYLWAYFTTRAGDFLLNEHSVGSAGRNRPLNMNTLVKESIPVPTIEAQMQVVRIVKAEKKIKKVIDKAIDLLKEKRIALISAVVTGKIDVRGEI